MTGILHKRDCFRIFVETLQTQRNYWYATYHALANNREYWRMQPSWKLLWPSSSTNPWSCCPRNSKMTIMRTPEPCASASWNWSCGTKNSGRGWPRASDSKSEWRPIPGIHPRPQHGCRKLRFNNFLNSKTMDRATIIYIAFVVTVLGIFLISEMIPLLRDKEYREKFMLEERAKAREKAARKRAEYSRLEPNTTYGRYKRMMRGERDWWRWK